MTGRELIIHILSNKLEEEQIFTNGKFLGFLTQEEAAEKLDVGIATVRAWADLGRIPSICIYEQLYIPANVTIVSKLDI